MPPLIVFTTAYKEFAHEAFNLNACDYLLKPFSFERFIQAVDKAKEKAAITQVALPEQGINVFTYVRAEGKIFKIDFNKLKYAEARGNNVRIVMDGYQFLPAMTFNRLEELLPKAVFSRVHRSFIVNKSRIQLIEGNRIFIDDTEIPIGTHYRERFLKEIGIKGL
jgi:DNA-binding LytR/AlgR family response regulator